MGNKRPSTRTLPSGEKVRSLPPSPGHPEGHEVLIRDSSPLRERLDARKEDNQRRHAVLAARHAERVEVKRAAQAEKGLAPEKSPI